MNKFKFAVATLVIVAGTIGAFAFSNIKDKDSVKEEIQTYYYSVDYESGSDYVILEIGSPSGTCPGGSDACEFSSPTSLGTTVLKTDVDNEQNGIVVLGNTNL
ncbi:hypothetical protein NO995_07260 [Aestuariibaculum sp. M13]|uniref:hypothetical protein n=1 Tax=Aestuariibaculum sp. M13 TaxID=2967132 RepID=UPI002159E3D8|nr:hypothetical protein [Aestuariibaculum sp. M13]MCR8667472.1 hypothetical protein [Aestuariibaculum sp. M13]